MRPCCHIGLALDHVSVTWRSWRGDTKEVRQPLSVPADGVAHPGPEENLAALDIALDKAVPAGRLVSPRVEIALADPYFRTAIMHLAALPRRQGDRQLVVTQRFCREHRLEARSFSVAFAVLDAAARDKIVLVCAMPRNLGAGLVQLLAKHSLHADVIAPEFLDALAHAASAGAAPTVLVASQPRYATLLVLSRPGRLAHIATLRQGAATTEDLAERVNARLTRYASDTGGATTPVVVSYPPTTAIGAPVFRPSGLPRPPRANLNFSRDHRAAARALSTSLAAIGVIGVVAALTLWSDAERLAAASRIHTQRAAQALSEIRLAETRVTAPDLQAFSRLRTRIVALSALDFAASLPVGTLCATLEEMLPDNARLTSLNYDRSRRRAELVAVSTSSADLTRLFELLDRHAALRNVRLVDKKSIADRSGPTLQQVHLTLDTGDAPPSQPRSKP